MLFFAVFGAFSFHVFHMTSLENLEKFKLRFKLTVSFYHHVTGKFGAVLASIPLPIFGALYCILFAYMSTISLFTFTQVPVLPSAIC